MPRKIYSEINLHITWHTKHNSPVLTTEIEIKLHDELKRQVLKTKGAFFHEVGGTKDHIHLAVSILPTLLISEWIGKLKGASSHYINHEIANRKLLEWQEGYGVVSFGTKDLKWVKRYVQNQKEHHARGKIYDRLERINSEED